VVIMKIEVDRDVCASSGMCVLTAPDVFDQDEEDGRVVLLVPDPPEEFQGAAHQAAQLCPTRAITVTD
jgi:ferredoxin